MSLPGKLNPIEAGGLRGGILTVARDLPATFDEWRQGVVSLDECGDSGLTTCVDPATAPDKTVNSLSGTVAFDPFIAYHSKECSRWLDEGLLADMTRRGMERGLSKQVALQLQTDAAGTGNPSLNSTAVDITPGGGPEPVVNTLAGLLEAACDCSLGDLVLHVPLRALPMLLKENIVEWNESAGMYMLGHHPVSVDCYSSTGPGAVVAGPQEGWFYVTGPIEVAFGDAIQFGNDVDATNVDRNIVERLSIVRFDTCCVQAAIAQVC